MAYAMQELLQVLQARALQQQLEEQSFWNRLARQMIAGEPPVELAWTTPREPESVYTRSTAAVKRRRSRPREREQPPTPQNTLSILAALMAARPEATGFGTGIGLGGLAGLAELAQMGGAF